MPPGGTGDAGAAAGPRAPATPPSGAQRVFVQAAQGFRELVAQIEPTQWASPGLGEWTVLDLVGHTSRALTTVEDYLRRGAPTIDVPDALTYFRQGRAVRATRPGIDAEIAVRGRQAGAALEPDPPAAVDRLVRRVIEVVQGASPDAVLGTIGGGMTLAAYLPTRTFELAVHGVDLAHAVGATLPAAYDEPLLQSADLVVRLAREAGELPAVLRALLGRGVLPEGFTLL